MQGCEKPLTESLQSVQAVPSKVMPSGLKTIEEKAIAYCRVGSTVANQHATLVMPVSLPPLNIIAVT